MTTSNIIDVGRVAILELYRELGERLVEPGLDLDGAENLIQSYEHVTALIRQGNGDAAGVMAFVDQYGGIERFPATRVALARLERASERLAGDDESSDPDFRLAHGMAMSALSSIAARNGISIRKRRRAKKS